MTRDEFMGVVYDELYRDGDNNRANRIIDAADSYVDEYAPHWIPVAERLPKEFGAYQVTTTHGKVATYCFVPDSISSHEYWKRCVTAWMPLPEPYKGVTE